MGQSVEPSVRDKLTGRPGDVLGGPLCSRAASLPYRSDEQARGCAGLRTVKEITRRHGVSEQSFYRWKAKYAGLEVSEVRRLKELEAENAKLKKLLAEAHLDNAALKDVVSRKW